jgi:hypothetical protein
MRSRSGTPGCSPALPRSRHRVICPTKYRIDAGAQPTARVEELRLLHGERVIATSPTAPTTFNIYGHMFGAGPVELRTEAIFDNGMRVRSDPAVINVDFTAGTPSGAAPVAYDYTKRVLADSPALIELPANYDDEAVNATFQLVTFPSQAAFHPGTAAPYRILLPMEGASGVDSFSFKVTTPAGTSNTATITVEYTSEDPGIEGDLDGDGCVDLADLGILLASFGIDDGGDINGDGETDLPTLGAARQLAGRLLRRPSTTRRSLTRSGLRCVHDTAMDRHHRSTGSRTARLAG